MGFRMAVLWHPAARHVFPRTRPRPVAFCDDAVIRWEVPMRGMRALVSLSLTIVAGDASLLALPGAADGPPTRPPGSPPRLAEVGLGDIPTTVSYRGWPVLVRYPEDPEVRARGGSGGPIVEIVVTSPEGAPLPVFQVQTIGLALVQSTADGPAIESWSSAGGGTYTRAVYAWRARERRYCADRVDEFEDHGDETPTPATVRMAGRGRLVRSRPFGCE